MITTTSILEHYKPVKMDGVSISAYNNSKVSREQAKTALGLVALWNPHSSDKRALGISRLHVDRAELSVIWISLAHFVQYGQLMEKAWYEACGGCGTHIIMGTGTCVPFSRGS